MRGARDNAGRRRLRTGIALAGGFAAALGAGYILQVPLATATWPFPVTPITYQFLGAVALAFAVPTLWVVWTGDIAALAGIALTIAAVFALVAVVLVSLARPDARFLPAAIVMGVVAVVAAAGYVLSSRRAPDDTRSTPGHIRAIFVVLAAVLVVGGGAMVMRVPNVLPWSVDLDSQALIGAIFVGDAAYFLLAARRPAWPHAAGALLAFLAYDVVLLIPLIDHAHIVRPEHTLGLIIYIAVVAATMVLAVYQLAIDRGTRLHLAARTAAPAARAR